MKYLLFLILLSCSVASFLVGKLDSYMASQTADRLHLYVKQEDQLEQDLEALFNEVKPQVNTIIQGLKIARTQDQKNISPDILNPMRKDFVLIYGKMTYLLAKYNGEMSKKQMDLFLNDFKKRQKKALKKIKMKRYKKRVPEKFAEIFGDLTKEQKAYLVSQLQPFFDWNKHRFEVNEFIVKNLESISWDDKRKSHIKNLYTKVLEKSQVNFVTNLDRIIPIINHFLDTLTEEQKEEINDKLDLAIDILISFKNNKY